MENKIQFELNKLDEMVTVKNDFNRTTPIEPKTKYGKNKYFVDYWIQLQLDFYDYFDVVRDELETMDITKQSMVDEMERAIDKQRERIFKMRIQEQLAKQKL